MPVNNLSQTAIACREEWPNIKPALKISNKETQREGCVLDDQRSPLEGKSFRSEQNISMQIASGML